MESLYAGTFALVTGASSGIGEAFARELARRGADLVLAARSTDKLQALAAELGERHGIRAHIVTSDLSESGGAERLCAEVDRSGLAITHLVSNAGFGTNGAFAASDAARQAEMVRLNCEALTMLSRHFLPRLLESRGGGILHVASIAGFQPVPYMATYGATKAFVIALSLAIAEEVRGSGVRVTALCPGPVPTGFQRAAGSGIAPSQRRATMSAEEVVLQGLADYERGRTLSVPGRINRAQLLAARLAPRPLVVRAVGRMMRAKKHQAPQ